MTTGRRLGDTIVAKPVFSALKKGEKGSRMEEENNKKIL